MLVKCRQPLPEMGRCVWRVLVGNRPRRAGIRRKRTPQYRDHTERLSHREHRPKPNACVMVAVFSGKWVMGVPPRDSTRPTTFAPTMSVRSQTGLGHEDTNLSGQDRRRSSSGGPGDDQGRSKGRKTSPGCLFRGHEISALDNAEFAEANSRATVVTLCVVAAISCVVAFAVVCLLRS